MVSMRAAWTGAAYMSSLPRAPLHVAAAGAFFTPGDSKNVGLDAPCIADVSLVLLGSKPMRRSGSWPKMQ
jgi:hypothetical protein